MKTLPVWLAATAFPVLAFGAAQQKAAPVSGPVAYVSSQRISNETAEGKAGIARLQALQRERQADARAKQQALEATRRELSAARDDATRARLQSQEQQQRTDFERAVGQAQADIQALQRQISAELGAKVKAILDEKLKGSEVQVVLSSDTSVIWAAPGLDMTSQVVERLNAQAPAPPKP